MLGANASSTMKKIPILDIFSKRHFVNEGDILPRVSVYGIYQNGREVLMVKDSKSKKWEFPGGGVDGGENLEQTLVREFVEETGLKPIGFNTTTPFFIATELFFDVASSRAWNSKRLFFMVEKIQGKHKKNGNCDDVEISEFVEIPKLVKSSNNTVAKIIQKMVADQNLFHSDNQKVILQQ